MISNALNYNKQKTLIHYKTCVKIHSVSKAILICIALEAQYRLSERIFLVFILDFYNLKLYEFSFLITFKDMMQMVFSSIIFLFLFLPLVLLTYFIIPEKLKNLFLMLLSLLFYFWGENFLIWIILAIILINYISSLYIEKAFSTKNSLSKSNHDKSISSNDKLTEKKAKIWLSISITLSLMLLAYFKYADFFVDNFNIFSGTFFSDKNWFIQFEKTALPLGISFYTFQAMSYTIDVYRREVKANRNFIDFACYVMLFPQLVAGPIVRYRDIETQLKKRSLEINGFSEGVFRFVIGLAKKVIIANTAAEAADIAFSLPSNELSTSFAWLGCVCYTLQIYFDFSGYSDMAIGLGYIFGFRFLENFNYPYIADSIQDFWRRWHISLSTWFKDYLYIPLGGNQKGKIRTYFNLFIVFVLCGFWHGASWNFILWGIYYAVFIVAERMWLKNVLDTFPKIIRHSYVILIVMMGWVMFRADNLTHAFEYLKIMMGFSSETADNSYQSAFYCDSFLITTIIAGIFCSAPFAKALIKLLNRFLLFHIAGYFYIVFIFFLSVIILSSGSYNPFIYFKF